MQQSYQPYGQNSPQATAQMHAPSAQVHACPDSGTANPAAGLQPPRQASISPQADHYYQSSGAEYGYSPAGTALQTNSAGRVGSWFEFSNAGYLKGFLIGAGATLVLTNPAVQKSLVRGTIKVWSLLQGGVEEVKEQFRDIKSEMSEEK